MAMFEKDSVTDLYCGTRWIESNTRSSYRSDQTSPVWITAM